MQSQDIRQLVQREGKSARNLVTWSVPATDLSQENSHQELESNEGFTPVTKKTRRSRQRGRSRGDGYSEQNRRQKYVSSSKPILSHEKKGAPPPLSSKVSEEVCMVVAEHYSDMHAKQRQTRASKSPSMRVDLQARYWSYLFDNLHRAVDEIYATCEADESVIECQEVIMTLELCQRDFEALIRRFQLFEQQQLQPKKSNLAWEVRKTTSPIKHHSQGLQKSLSPSTSPSHHRSNPPSHPHKTRMDVLTHHHLHTDTPSHPHSHTAAPSNSTHKEPNPKPSSQISKPNTTQSNSTVRHSPQLTPRDTNTAGEAGPTAREHHQSSSETQAQSNSEQDGMATSYRPKLPSRPSSARSLDFSTCSNEGRVDSPLLKRSKSQGKADVDAKTWKSEVKRESKVVSGGPTWADRVRGLAKPVTMPSARGNDKIKSCVFDSVGVAHSEKSLKNSENDDEGSDLEEGWERVTRVRSRSASSGRSGNHGYKHSTGTTRTKKKKSSDSSTSRSNSSASVEPTTPPVFEDPPQIVLSTTTESDPLRGERAAMQDDKMAESSDPRQNDLQEERVAEPKDKMAESSASDSIPLPDEKTPEQEDKMAETTVRVVGQNDGTPLPENEAVKEEAKMAVGDEKDSIPVQEADEVAQVTVEEVKEKTEEPASQEEEPWTWNDVMADYEAGESYRQEVSWADRCDSPSEALPEIPRSPGRAIHLHQRLSSPSRRRPPVEDVEESRRLHREKQVKAELHRSRMLEEKTQKYKMASDKIREARESRDARIRQQREALEGKLQRAEMLRESHLQEIVRKAQEEEAKVSEISFINTLEAQNKKMEVLERHEVHKARLQEIQDERQRKREEQLAKEEAAMERRRMLESERVAKLMEQEVKRKEQEAKIEQMRQERERAREDSAREKARERERKLEARNAAIQTSVVELERKIQQKHHESLRRYGQQLEQKKMVAVSISRHTSSDDAPNVEVYKKKKWCTVCDVGIISEVYLLSHLRGRKHQEALASLPSEANEGDLETPVIIEADEEQQRLPREKPEVIERMRAGKKRAKKIRHRMASRVREEVWPATSAVHSKNRPKLQRSIKELNRQLDAIHPHATPTPHTITWEGSQLTHIERCLGDLSRCLSGGGADDRLCFSQLGGLSVVMRLFVLSMMDGSGKKRPSDKALQYAVNVLQASCSGHPDNCAYLILSNKMAPLIDLSLQLLSEVHPRLEASQGSMVTSLCGGLVGLIAEVVSTIASGPLEKREDLCQPVVALVSYLVSVGLVDRISDYFGTINGPIADFPVTQLVLAAINLIMAVTACMHIRVSDVFSSKPSDDPSLLPLVLHQTELARLMQLLYAILLHDGPPRHSSTPPPLTQHTLAIATAAIRAVNNSAILDLQMVQSCLGAEGISLEFRHVVSYLLWHCSHNRCTDLLHELVLAVGYFCVQNRDNQVFLQSGRSPTLLQLLCDLPFPYFSSPELTKLLFPTLISACYLMEENVCILEQDISCKLLVAFLQEMLAKKSSGVGTPNKPNRSLNFSGLEYRFPRSEWEKAITFFNR